MIGRPAAVGTSGGREPAHVRTVLNYLSLLRDGAVAALVAASISLLLFTLAIFLTVQFLRLRTDLETIRAALHHVTAAPSEQPQG